MKTKSDAIFKADIVLISDDKQPYHIWNLSCIRELNQSKDAVVGVAKVLMGSTGIMIDRPLSNEFLVTSKFMVSLIFPGFYFFHLRLFPVSYPQ